MVESYRNCVRRLFGSKHHRQSGLKPTRQHKQQTKIIKRQRSEKCRYQFIKNGRIAATWYEDTRKLVIKNSFHNDFRKETIENVETLEATFSILKKRVFF